MSTQAGDIMVSTGPFVLCTRYFTNERTDFAAHWRKWSSERRCETVNVGNREFKVQGHRRPK